MGGVRPGAARDLGLAIEWQWAFVGMGERATPRGHALFLDVGGACARGVIDQHQGAGRAGSTAALVLAHPEYVYEHLLKPWLPRHHRGEDLRGRPWRPLMVTHRDPDFDALVATWLARRLVEDGEFPAGAHGLVQYVDEVDQGAYRVDPERPETWRGAFHLVWLTLQHDRSLSDAERVRRGHEALERFVSRVVEAAAGRAEPLGRDDFHPTAPGADASTDPELAEFVRRLEGDRQTFEADWQAGERIRGVVVPAADGPGTVEIDGFVSRAPPRSMLHKYWVRARGLPLYVARIAERRVVVSVDPTWTAPDGRRVCLRGLGRALELAEHEARRGRDGRPGPPRYPDRWCTTADPWYDGRGHAHTIVDSPRSGTELEIDAIVRVLRSRFWAVELLRGSRVVACGPHPLPHPPAGWRAGSERARDELPASVRPALEPLPADVRIGARTVGRLHHVSAEVESPASLADLAAWAEALPPRTWIGGAIAVDGSSGSSAERDALLARVMGGPFSRIGERLDAIHVGPRAVLRIVLDDDPERSRAGAVAEALCPIVAWVDTAVAGVADLVGEAERGRGAARLQRDLVALERERMMPIRKLPNPWRRVALTALDAAATQVQFSMLRSEVDRLVETEESDVERQVQTVLGLFTAVGIASATTDVLNSSASVSTVAIALSVLSGWVLWSRQSHRSS